MILSEWDCGNDAIGRLLRGMFGAGANHKAARHAFDLAREFLKEIQNAPAPMQSDMVRAMNAHIQAGTDAAIEDFRSILNIMQISPLALDASDDDVCQAADNGAERCNRLMLVPWLAKAGREIELRHEAMRHVCKGRQVMPPDISAYQQKAAMRQDAANMAAITARQAVARASELVQDTATKKAAAKADRARLRAVRSVAVAERAAGAWRLAQHRLAVAIRGAIARMQDPQWWRRALRIALGRQCERLSIRLGRVRKTREIYASNQAVARRRQQARRNAAMLENTVATNEEGFSATLAELAEKGPANKAIRRGELMTRINGFERVANKMGHGGLFMTITCPSRFHPARTTRKGQVIDNPRFDTETDPRAAQAYLRKVWANIRSALAYKGITLYGFRVAEPQHDATPHWHVLVFNAIKNMDTIREVVRDHALRDTPDEPGAQDHRCDFKTMGEYEGRGGIVRVGTAAGYIAKYIAKNIDGYAIEKDLCGVDAIVASQRVEAWASTWRIRQFQQIGGASVGVWRELRRVASLMLDAPQHLKDAHDAVNKMQVLEGREGKSVSWGKYTMAQGGPTCGRRQRIKLAKQDRSDIPNKYGEPSAPAPIGVETWTQEDYTPPALAGRSPDFLARLGFPRQDDKQWFCRSKRYQWTIKRRPAPAKVREWAMKPEREGSESGAVGDLGPVSITVRNRPEPALIHPDFLDEPPPTPTWPPPA